MEELFPVTAVQLARTEQALAACNAKTARFGLTLSREQIAVLAAGRTQALRNTGRVEFGEGILPRLVLAFCDSPYLYQEDYAETMLTLQEIFYNFKNEFQERLSDDRLLRLLRRAFDERAHGAAEYLAGLSPAELLAKREEPDDREM